MAAAEDPAEVLAALSFSGSTAGFREGLASRFPFLPALLSASGDDVKALASAFKGTPVLADDARLAIFAYALEVVGDSSTAEGLRDFLSANISGDLLLAPHIVARTIVSLTGMDELSGGSYWYAGDELQIIAGATSPRLARTKADDLGAGRKSCSRQYLLVGPSGAPLDYYDYDGVRRTAVVSGRVKSSDAMPAEYVEHWKDKVAKGGGTYVDNDAEFPGRPTPQFNCAGYVTRGFNGGKKWVADPARVFRVFEGTGSLVPVEESDIQEGDLVFYFHPQARGPGHVAEVHSVQVSNDPDLGIRKDVRVRNGDGMSGLWEASIDAPYFLGKGGVLEIKGDYERRAVYRWKDGRLPAFVADPSFEKNPDNCDYIPPVTCQGCTEGQFGTIYLGTTPSGELSKHNSGLYAIRADDGFTTLIAQQAVDGLAVSWDSKLLAAGMVSGTGALAGDAGIKLLDISGGGLAPRDPIFVLYDGDSPTDLTGPTWMMDNRTLVLSRVGDLHMFDTEARKGSLKIWKGWHCAAAPDSSLLVVETSGGLRGLIDAEKTAYKDYDPWDTEAGWMSSQLDAPENQFDISGTDGDSMRPRFCQGGGQPELIFLDRSDRTVVRVASVGSSGSGAASGVIQGPGGRIAAVTCSPDGTHLAVVVTETESKGGGVWVIPRSDPTRSKRLLSTDLSLVWYADVAWAY
jgi:hypothetical protein